MAKWKPHSAKQDIVVFGKKRITIAGTGIQWGKTDSGVIWLKSMMHKHTNPSDNFIVASPSYKILAQSTLPPFMRYMEHCGSLDKQNYCFNIHGGGMVWFRTGTNPDSVVGITNVRAVLCDEAGLYSRYFWDNLQARASFKEADIRIVTSPYSLNWLYTDFIKPFKKGDQYIQQICDVVQANSGENPYFPKDEYEARRRTMDSRRFNMIYGGNFDKAEGLVYDCFDQDMHQIDKFDLPAGTRVYAGVDWGYRDPFVISPRAVTPNGLHYKIGEYYKPQLTIDQMVEAAQRMKTLLGIERFYCDPSRPEYIKLFNQHGLPALPADNEIRLGIDRHYELIKSGQYFMFRGTSPFALDEYEQYHYPELKDEKPDQVQKDELPVDNNNHCIAEGQLIATDKGMIQVEQIKAGDKVLTRNGFKKVLFSGQTGANREVISITSENGNSVICTPNHEIFTSNGFLRADNVKYGDILLTLEGNAWLKHQNGMEKFIGAILTLKEELIGSISKNVRNIYIGKFGSIITALSLKAWSFIMLMVTLAITPLKILKWLLTKIIVQNIHVWVKEKRKSLSILLKSMIWQSLGIRQKKVGSYIQKTAKRLWPITSQLQRFVGYVIKNFNLFGLTTQTSNAPIHAKASGAALTRLTMKIGSVLSAIIPFQLTNTQKPKLVPSYVQAICKSKQRKNVYDLTIESDHEFLAGGLLVHNCMDAERYVTAATYKPRGHRRNKIIVHSDNYSVKPQTSAYHDNGIEKLKKRRKSYADIPL